MMKWRQVGPTHLTTLTTAAQVNGAARSIYADYPQILSALGLG